MQDHVDAPAVAKPCRRLEDLPGPRTLPLLGNLHQMHRERVHQDMENWAREYGPLFRVSLGRTPMLVVAAYRTTEFDPSGAFTETLAALAHEGCRAAVILEPLRLEETARLAENMAGGERSPR